MLGGVGVFWKRKERKEDGKEKEIRMAKMGI